MQWTPEMIDAVEVAMNAGEKRASIAARYGVSPRSVYGAARAAKDRDPSRFPTLLTRAESGYHEWTDGEVRRLEREWRLGVSGKNIADSLGISMNTLRQKIDAERAKDQRAGVTPRFPKRARGRREGRTTRLWVYVSADLHMRARRIARQRNMTMTAYIRTLLMRDAA